jgi:pentose-5-phosphate-3-epimerase
VHLELDNPDLMLENFLLINADLITVCLDTLPDPVMTIARIRKRGALVGISINPGDQLLQVRDVLPSIDMLILRGVHSGFGG